MACRTEKLEFRDRSPFMIAAMETAGEEARRAHIARRRFALAATDFRRRRGATPRERYAPVEPRA